MKKTKLKILIILTAFSFLFGMTIPTATTIVQANEIANTEVDQSEDYLAADPIDSDIVVLQEGEYYEEEQRSQQALKVIAEEYAEEAEETNANIADEAENGNEYTLTPEDEKRIDQALDQYLTMTHFNPRRLRGVGKNWWNSKGFVAGVIDVGLIVIGLGTAASSTAAVRKLIRNNRTNITRMVEKQILAKVGIGVGGLVSSMINIALTLAGTSIGGVLAEGLDRADRKNDNYICA